MLSTSTEYVTMRACPLVATSTRSTTRGAAAAPARGDAGGEGGSEGAAPGCASCGASPPFMLSATMPFMLRRAA